MLYLGILTSEIATLLHNHIRTVSNQLWRSTKAHDPFFLFLIFHRIVDDDATAKIFLACDDFTYKREPRKKGASEWLMAKDCEWLLVKVVITITPYTAYFRAGNSILGPDKQINYSFMLININVHIKYRLR